jgi:trehalose/maltose hydrolase-like predicted phosphorylase
VSAVGKDLNTTPLGESLGIQSRSEALWFDPRMPNEVRSVHFEVFYHGRRATVDISTARLRLQVHPSAAPPIAVGVHGSVTWMAPGQTRDFAL